MKSTTAVLLILAIAGAAPLGATLGQIESSVSADQHVMQGVDLEQSRQGYKLHQITAPDGTVVKEFISPLGLVFGISWQASHMPNLQQLLGSSMTELQVALQTKRPRWGGAPLIVKSDTLVFFSGGHMRSFRGYAYVPSLVPPNVSPEVVQ